MKCSILLLPMLFLTSLPLFSQTKTDKTYLLQNIEVKGKRFGGLTQGEVKQMQVERNLTGVTGTTADVFRQLPSVITDIEGGITYRGSNKPGLLINGIPYGLMEENSGDMLIQLPALFFNRISMTSMPSIELLPDGDAGVLNLSPAAYTRNDSPLQLTVGAGFQERYNAGAIVNLHPGKFHIIGKYDYRKEYRKRTFDKSTTNQNGVTLMNNNASARPDVHLADVSVGYDLSPRDLVTVYGLYHLMDYSRYGGIRNTKLSPAGEVQNKMIRHRYNDQRQEAYAVEGRWNHLFKNPEDQLSITFNYNNFGYDEDNAYKNEKPETGSIVAEDDFFVCQDKNNYYFSAVYRKVFGNDWHLRTGYIGRFQDEKYTSDGNKKMPQGWEPDTTKTDKYRFDRRTHLLFASIGKKWGNFSAEAGVQAETSWKKIRTFHPHRTLDKEEAQSNSRFHLYPRVKFAYRTGQRGELAFRYVQRTIRPTGADLNPFINSSDPTHVYAGNPDLKDEFIHSSEISYVYTAPGFQLAPSFYFRNKSNRIMEVVRQDMQDATYWQKQNVGHSRAVGFELSGTWRPVRILAIGFSGNIYRDQIDGRSIGYDEKKSMVSGDMKGSVNINITRTTELQVDGFYVSDQLTPQGKIKHRSSINAGISQYFMQRKLRVDLSMNNIFNGLKETTIVSVPGLFMTQVRNRDAQVTWLRLTYTL